MVCLKLLCSCIFLGVCTAGCKIYIILVEFLNPSSNSILIFQGKKKDKIFESTHPTSVAILLSSASILSELASTKAGFCVPSYFKAAVKMHEEVVILDSESDTHSLVSDTHSLVSDTHSLVSDTHSLVSDTHSLVSDTHSLVSDTHSLVSDTHSLVSDTHSLVSDTHSLVSDTHSLVSDTHSLV